MILTIKYLLFFAWYCRVLKIFVARCYNCAESFDFGIFFDQKCANSRNKLEVNEYLLQLLTGNVKIL